MRSFKSNENIHKKEGGSYFVVLANKASSVTLYLLCWRQSIDDAVCSRVCSRVFFNPVWYFNHHERAGLCASRTFETHRDKTNKMACAPSEDSDQPGHPPSLIRVFADRLKKA